MSLSKHVTEHPIRLDFDSISYDYDASWDNCDYVDPVSLTDNVSSEDLLIIQWNLRGLRGKLDDIGDLLNNTLEQKVGIVIICETWLNNKSPQLPPIKGYKFMGKPRIDRKGGGVGFLIRNDIIFRRKEELEVKGKILENMIIEVKCKTNILGCSSYRPPNTSIREFSTEYEEVLHNMLNHKHTNSIIGIDHNLDFVKHNLHRPTQNYNSLWFKTLHKNSVRFNPSNKNETYFKLDSEEATHSHPLSPIVTLSVLCTLKGACQYILFDVGGVEID